MLPVLSAGWQLAGHTWLFTAMFSLDDHYKFPEVSFHEVLLGTKIELREMPKSATAWVFYGFESDAQHLASINISVVVRRMLRQAFAGIPLLEVPCLVSQEHMCENMPGEECLAEVGHRWACPFCRCRDRANACFLFVQGFSDQGQQQKYNATKLAFASNLSFLSEMLPSFFFAGHHGYPRPRCPAQLHWVRTEPAHGFLATGGKAQDLCWEGCLVCSNRVALCSAMLIEICFFIVVPSV